MVVEIKPSVLFQFILEVIIYKRFITILCIDMCVGVWGGVCRGMCLGGVFTIGMCWIYGSGDLWDVARRRGIVYCVFGVLCMD